MGVVRYLRLLLVVLFALFGCGKTLIDDGSGKKGSNNVWLSFTPYTQGDFTRASDLQGQLSRLSVAVYKQDGTRVKSVAQKSGDAGFGQVALSLEQGIYKVVAIAHNGEGNATLTSTEKVTFANNKVTDTFYYYGTLEVGEEPIDKELTMTRCAAMLRLTLSSPLPDDVSRMKFYYTGGSSTFSPTLGFGCVQSKQTEYRDTRDSEGNKVKTFELYTLPHEKNDVLKVTITAQDADGQAVGEWTWTDVPVTMNKITLWEGKFFDDDGTPGVTTQGGIRLVLDMDWEGTVKYQW